MAQDTGEDIGGNGSSSLAQRGWGTSGTLRTTDRANKVSMQAVFSDPGSYTVQFDMIDNSTVLQARAKALVLWSVGGVEVSRQINVHSGASISGVGQGVRVIVTDDSKIFGGFDNYDYNVAITVSKGTRADIEQPPTLSVIALPETSTSNIILAATSVDIDLPPNVGAISVNVAVGSADGSVIADQQVQVLQRNDSAGQILSMQDPRMWPWIPLLPAARQLRIINRTAVSIRYAVTLGIDG